ncbi:outer membrane protein assembly factor BamE [Curvibacter sp. CHRR-16]|uniref:outer membrane protein assembly factor BamE n=1 Tax=Curvibacter sp. CHRR-16 TaxID=2835872 RepID=UPI001BD92101|nr:outer membrane protein assembly factor BamE [Curvibacter sp. CHRR-16]MBT0570459.1 outer membrane protein assembly factor BamE [Curvibacter sp. CHRR-16]
MQLLRNASLVACAVALVACASVKDQALDLSKRVEPYRIDVVQGNVVTREQLAAVQVGMTRNNVQDILGSPLLTSVFHGNRWDYVFTFRRQGAPEQSRRVTVWFKGDKVDSIDADALPSENDFVATLKSLQVKGPLPELTAPSDKLPARNTEPSNTTSTSSTDTVAAPSKAYPPLEPVSQ